MMIILTTPEIKAFTKRITSIVEYAGQQYCLAIVDENFAISKQQMLNNNIDFWWQCAPGPVDCEEWDVGEWNNVQFKGGIVEGVELVFGLSKNRNIAMVIGSLCNYLGCTEFELWKNAIKRDIKLKKV